MLVDFHLHEYWDLSDITTLQFKEGTPCIKMCMNSLRKSGRQGTIAFSKPTCSDVPVSECKLNIFPALCSCAANEVQGVYRNHAVCLLSVSLSVCVCPSVCAFIAYCFCPVCHSV